MKTLTRPFSLIITAILVSWSLNAQQLFSVHEDIVNPDKMMQYETAAQTLHRYIKDYGKDMRYSTAMTNTLHYLYIMPVENYGALDNMDQQWGDLTNNVGKEKMNNLWQQFDECYDVHRNYMVRLSEELSYYPSGEIMSDEGGNYRRWTYIYAYPDKMDELMEVAKKWKAMSKEKGIERGYRIYLGDMGTELGTLLIVDYGKDMADIAIHEKNVQEKMGPDGQQLWLESMQYIRKMDEVYGSMRPDLSHYPE